MHHFFTQPALVKDGRALLTGDEARHATRVLRVKVGETISIADGTGRVVDAVVTKAATETVETRVILVHEPRQPVPACVLVQAVSRKEKMDLVIQKAVELGAREIVPFLADRSVVRWDDAKRRKATERWSGIALSAAKQCRSPWSTTVGDVASSIADVDIGAATLLVLHEQASEPFRAALPDSPPDRLAVVVGPEGGLTDEEVGVFTAAGGRAVTLGERILRTETAGPVALALVAYTYGNLG